MRIKPTFDIDDAPLAWVAWNRLAEPGDVAAGALLEHLGPTTALRWLLERGKPGLLESSLAPEGAFESRQAKTALMRAAAGWAPRLADLDPERDLATITRLGGFALLRDDPRWPIALHDLGAAEPCVLWVRGDAELLGAPSVAVVGSRASTSYGEFVANDLAGGLVERGFSVISGGAYGIDAAAHRGALAVAAVSAGGGASDGGGVNEGDAPRADRAGARAGSARGASTIAVMAGGLDRFYPVGNTNLLRTIAEAGAVISEAPPGVAPFKHRFLARNRLIAGLSRASVVVEAAWRSGALSTANHAAALLRPVGAVPGPVTSMASTGCNQLIREGVAVCVTDAAEVAELAESLTDGGFAQVRARFDDDPLAGLERSQRLVADALPWRATATPDSLTRTAGQPLTAVLAALGVLEARGLAEQSATGKWRRVGIGGRIQRGG